MNDKELNQTGGDGSTNQQAVTINNHHNHYGPTETQIRQIQSEIFRENMTVLAGHVAEIVMARGTEFSERLIAEKLLPEPSLMAAFADPSMQIAAYEAQKCYAKSGDVKTADLLLDFLAARAEHPERNLQQIVIDESLAIVPKLTNGLLDILSALFLVNQGLNGIHSFSELEEYLIAGLTPIIDNLIQVPENYNYLKYLNCVEELNDGMAFTDTIMTKAARLMYSGIPVEEFESGYGSVRNFVGFIEPWPHNPSVVKYTWDDFTAIDNVFNNPSIDIGIRGAVHGIRHDRRMNVDTHGNYLLRIPIILRAQNLWFSCPLIKLTTTHIGALIGQAHLKHYAGISTRPVFGG
jgi:hypothetical protein